MNGSPDNPKRMFLLPLDKVEIFMNEKYFKNYTFKLDKGFIELKDIDRKQIKFILIKFILIRLFDNKC